MTVVARRSSITGEWLSYDPAIEIHEDDLEWLERSWEPIDALGWEIRMAADGLAQAPS